MQLALAGIAKNGYSTHSLAKFSTQFCITNTNAIAKSSVWTELNVKLITRTESFHQNDVGLVIQYSHAVIPVVNVIQVASETVANQLLRREYTTKLRFYKKATFL